MISFCRNVDKVDETMEEINETMDVAKEISDVISQPVGDPLDEVSVMFENIPVIDIFVHHLIQSAINLFDAG